MARLPMQPFSRASDSSLTSCAKPSVVISTPKTRWCRLWCFFAQSRPFCFRSLLCLLSAFFHEKNVPKYGRQWLFERKLNFSKLPIFCWKFLWSIFFDLYFLNTIYMYMFMILFGSFNIIGMQDLSEINGQTLSTYNIFACICSSNILTEYGY